MLEIKTILNHIYIKKENNRERQEGIRNLDCKENYLKIDNEKINSQFTEFSFNH